MRMHVYFLVCYLFMPSAMYTFRRKLAKPFIWSEELFFGINNSPAAPRIAIHERTLVLCCCVISVRQAKATVNLEGLPQTASSCDSMGKER